MSQHTPTPLVPIKEESTSSSSSGDEDSGGTPPPSPDSRPESPDSRPESPMPHLVEDTDDKEDKEEEKPVIIELPIIDFDRLFKALKVSHTEEKNAYDLTVLLNKDEYKEVDILSYPFSLTIVPNNLAFFKRDDEGRLYLNLIPIGECDFANDFSVTDGAELSIVLNGKKAELTPETKLFPSLLLNANFFIRITFTSDPVEITFKHKAYVMKNNLRKEMSFIGGLVSGIISYRAGKVLFVSDVEENKEDQNKDENKIE
jgi:hypothetical protein